MQLCLECGRIEDHTLECKRRPASPSNPAEKQQRVQKAMAVAQAVHDRADEAAKESPKVAILKLLAAEGLLERWPSRDLTAFDTKRAHNDLVSALQKKRASLEATAGTVFTEDARFAKQAVESYFAQCLRREEAKRVDLSALGELPVKPITGLDRPIKAISNEIDQRLEESRDVAGKVTEWGWKNLGRLMLGLDPFEIPRALLGPGTGVLGKLGVGKGERTAELNASFKPLGDRFRERLYLIGASTVLLPIMSRLAQTEEAWRRLLAKNDGAARWERIKQGEKELAEYFVGQDPALPGGIEDVIQSRALASPMLVTIGLRPAREVRGVEWEGWAKGYFLELEAITSGQADTHEFGTRRLARLLIERRPGVDVSRERVAETLALLQASWREKPPGGTPSS